VASRGAIRAGEEPPAGAHETLVSIDGRELRLGLLLAEVGAPPV